MSQVRFYTDEHISRAVIAGLRRCGIDMLTTSEAKLLGAPDEAQLALAASQGRVVVTQDDDFLRFHAQGVMHIGDLS